MLLDSLFGASFLQKSEGWCLYCQFEKSNVQEIYVVCVGSCGGLGLIGRAYRYMWRFGVLIGEMIFTHETRVRV